MRVSDRSTAVTAEPREAELRGLAAGGGAHIEDAFSRLRRRTAAGSAAAASCTTTPPPRSPAACRTGCVRAVSRTEPVGRTSPPSSAAQRSGSAFTVRSIPGSWRWAAAITGRRFGPIGLRPAPGQPIRRVVGERIGRRGDRVGATRRCGAGPRWRDRRSGGRGRPPARAPPRCRPPHGARRRGR